MKATNGAMLSNGVFVTEGYFVEITLNNGYKITGEATEIDERKIEFFSGKYGETLSNNWDDVKDIQLA